MGTAIFWLVLGTTIGLYLGIKFVMPDNGKLSFMISAYDKGNQKSFIINGSETPQTIPFWIWIIIILFWAIYYEITSANVQL